MDIPDVPFNIQVGLALAQSGLVADAKDLDENLKPSPDQYAIKPGDVAMLAGSTAKVDQDFTVVKILDASEFAGTYPDWETRLQNSYVLCQWNSASDPEGDIGWISRVKLVEIEQEQYDQIRVWIDSEDGPPDQVPSWVTEAYNRYIERLSDTTPGAIPKPATCGLCGSRNVEIHAVHMVTLSATAGVLTKDGKTTYTIIGSDERSCEHAAHLHCNDCNAHGTLSDEEFPHHG